LLLLFSTPIINASTIKCVYDFLPNKVSGAKTAYACTGTVHYDCLTYKYTVEGITNNHKEGKGWSDVTMLSLSGAQFVIEIPSEIGAYFRNLEIFICQYCQIERMERRNLEQLMNLKYLDLSHNTLKRLDGDFFADIPNIEFFSVAFNHIESVGPELFSNVKHLKDLQVHHNVCYRKYTHSSLEEKMKDFVKRCQPKNDVGRNSSNKTEEITSKGRRPHKPCMDEYCVIDDLTDF
jgi:Leucine-rich repeat (LRR) protein